MKPEHSRSKRVVIVTGFAVISTIVGAAAQAHVEASPTKVKAGTVAVISFNVPHGCAGSPTTKLAIKIPTGLANATAVAKKGWTSSVAGGVITFAGGSIPPKTVSIFKIKATTPTAATTLVFPTIQTCAKGETAWIEASPVGKPEPDHPAPSVRVVK